MPRYVQHKSGVGEKWKVFSEEPLKWGCYRRGISLGLPKSEYIECPPPEQWVDVTGECEWVEHPSLGYPWTKDWYIQHKAARVEGMPEAYRVIKVQLDGQWAFIVEQKVS